MVRAHLRLDLLFDRRPYLESLLDDYLFVDPLVHLFEALVIDQICIMKLAITYLEPE